MAQDFNNIPAGLNIPTQIPLNIKENVLNEATLAYLGLSNNLAYTYHDQMIVTCLEEGSRYIWREVQIGEENTGLVPLDFTYPDNIITYGINYSNRTFNFFKLPGIEDIFNVVSVGAGVPIFNGITGTTAEISALNSSNIDIVKNLDGSITLTGAEDSTLRFTVNSDYIGTEELGTQTKPFKNLQNALDAYVGNGVSNKVPQFLGYIIDVIKDENIFTGSLVYEGLQIIYRDGSLPYSNPSASEWLIDLDSEAILPTNPNYLVLPYGDAEPVTITITTEGNSAIRLLKQGIKNRGTNSLTPNTYKSVVINGQIHIEPDVSVVSPSTRTIFSCNADNQVGFLNPGQPQIVLQGRVVAQNSKIAILGQSSQMYTNNSTLRFGVNGVPFNSNTVPITMTGGYINALQMGGNVVIENEFNNAPTYSLINFISMKTQGGIGSRIEALNSIIGRNCEYVILNADTGATTSNTLSLDSCLYSNSASEAYLKSLMSSGVWNVKLVNCNILTWGVDDSKIQLIPNSVNTLGQQVVETLSQYLSKNAAKLSGLFSGCAFVKKEDTDADDLQSGVEYKITTVGSPALGTLGDYFIATGTETGTGVGTLYTREIII